MARARIILSMRRGFGLSSSRLDHPSHIQLSLRSAYHFNVVVRVWLQQLRHKRSLALQFAAVSLGLSASCAPVASRCLPCTFA
jgi:type II secretory pathway component PulM